MSTPVRLAILAAVGLFLTLPLIVVAGVSVDAGQQLVFPPRGFSLGWYVALVTEPDWRIALENSVVIALAAPILAVSVALPLAYVVWRYGGRAAQALFGLGIMPFTLPPVVLALGFLVFWINAGGYGQIYATIIGHTIFLVAVPLVTIGLGLNGIDPRLTEAARTLGASDLILFRTIVVPWIRPYVISGLAFAFVLSLNEYIIAYMIAGFTVETVPIKVFNALRYGYTPIMAAASVVFALAPAIVFSLIALIGDLPKLMGAWSRTE